MINLVERFDFLSEINEEIKQMVIALHGNSIPNEDVENSVFSPNIVGQEEDGIIIFTWRLNFTSLANTYIALYHQVTHKSRLIFTQEKNIEVVTATVNTDRTLVAFSIVERKNSSGYVSPGDNGDIYKSYIAEICPQNRVFFLNIEWRTYQKVVFLRESFQGSQNISHMLFFHHKESIGLYHVPVTEKDNRFVMSMQPSTQQISDKFIWSQFDKKTQRLYFLQLIPADEKCIHATSLLTVVDFKNNGDYDYIFKLPLPITFKGNLMDQKAVYYQHYFSPFVSSNSFNMAVLSNNAGSFYVCYQHPLVEKVSDGKSDITCKSSSSTDSFSSDATSSVNYTICCVHGGYKVQCSHLYSIDDIDSTARIFFYLFNDYMLVFFPWSFLHLLDIGCEHEPVHNLLLNNDMGLLPEIGDRNQFPLFSTIIETTGSLQQNLIIFENNNLKAYTFELCSKGLSKYFLVANAVTRLAILHASMCHLNDNSFAQNILKRACQDSANMETSDILKEYLILSAYLHMKRIVVSPLDLKIFPFTSQEVYRGQVERKENGERLLHLDYKEFTEDVAIHFRKILRKRRTPFWSNVFLHLSYEVEYRNKRFPLKLLRHASVNSEVNFNTTKSLFREKSTDLEKSWSTSSLPNIVNNPMETRDNVFRNSISAEKIVSHVTNTFGRETKSKASNMCREYSVCRIKMISLLWKVILKSLKISKNEDLMSVNLSEPISEIDVSLFQLLERLNCLIDQLCYPGFPNMKRLLCFLGFRCLSTYQFFQYVDACIFELDTDFVQRVLFELSDDEEQLKTKLKMVSYMTKENAHILLKEWDHEYGNKYLAKHIMRMLPSDNVHYNSGIPESDETGEKFVPLRTLLESCKLLGKKSGFLRSTNNEMFEADIDFVGKVALTNTDGLNY